MSFNRGDVSPVEISAMEEEEKNVLLSKRQVPNPDASLSTAPNPLRGVVLCCTSIPTEQRTELVLQAEQMGARHTFDLTSDVTHLIVGEYDTPKYRYVARERPDVRVMVPGWIETVRELWIEDQAIDMEAVAKEHTLPTFAGLRICLTGFEDLEERQNIINLIEADGAEYRGDLTKHVTHLIVYRPEGAKYKHAKVWGIHRVSPEWLQQSLERGMILDEELFNPELPVKERGKGAWIRRKRSPLTKRSRDGNTAGLEEGKRKLRRTASTKLNGQNEKIWGDIVGTSSTVQTTENVDGSTTNEDKPRAHMSIADAQESPSDDPKEVTQGTFSGCQFYIHGFEPKKLRILQKHLLSHGGVISSSLEDLPGLPSRKPFLVVPNWLLAADVPALPQLNVPTQTVTDWWVERCVIAKRFVDPAEYALGCPFNTFSIRRFNELRLCSTGFEPMPLLHIMKVVALIGAKYDETFSTHTSVLICNPSQNMRRDKLACAREWKVPVVSLNWLLDSIRKGERQPFRPYLQRLKKERTGSESSTGADEKPPADGLKTTKEVTNDPGGVKNKDSRLENVLNIDPTAFTIDDDITVKSEEDSVIDPRTVGTHTPLNEVSPNPPRKIRSRSKESVLIAPVALMPPIPQEAISTAISTAITSLLAKSKPVTNQDPNQFQAPETHEGGRRKRAPSRILGRAASNISISATSDRASSVDSTASTGAAGIWPSGKSVNRKSKASSSSSSSLRGSAKTAAEMMTLSMMHDLEGQRGDEDATGGPRGLDDQAPPLTQMQYVDPESSEYRAKVLARVRGEKTPVKGKERVATIGNLGLDGELGGEAPRMRTRRGKVRG